MRLLRWAFVIVLALPLATADTASAKGGGKKSRRNRFRGTVVKVDKESITVKARDRKRAAGKEKTFKISADTKFEKIEGRGRNRKKTAATVADVEAGSRVRVRATGDTARLIQVVARKSKKSEVTPKQPPKQK